MKTLAALLTILTLAAPHVSHAQDATIEGARDAFVAEFRSVFSKQYRAGLSERGYDTDEVNRLLEALADGYADCDINFFLSRPEKAFRRAMELMNDEANKANLKKLMGSDFDVLMRVLSSHKEDIEACYHNIHVDLGLLDS